jgi:NAD(P)-dependent dehydrogenase (short-subunit alcohol dehydrogenase family)
MKIQEMMNLKGKNALVTGGTGYVGSFMCSALIDLGANVIAVSRGKSSTYLDDYKKNKQLNVIQKDLSTKQGVNECLVEIKKYCNEVNILINNSYTWPKVVNYFDQDWNDFKGTIDSGIISQLYLTKFIFNDMIENKQGIIINVASMYGKVSPDFSMYRESSMGNAIEYGISKAGMIQFTKYLASLGGKYNIRSNSISPGPFPREGALDGKEWFEKELNAKTMLGRVGKGEELKGVSSFLASDLSTYVTGTDIAVDGGWTSW